MEKQTKKELEYNSWKDYLNSTRERTFYSIQRMDLLIIAICGAGIYIFFETIREFKPESGELIMNNAGVLILSGIAFLLGILSNFISQWTGYLANTYEENYCNLRLSELRGDKIKEKKLNKLDEDIKFYNNWTKSLNMLSIIIMFIGVTLLTIFNLLLF